VFWSFSFWKPKHKEKPKTKIYLVLVLYFRIHLSGLLFLLSSAAQNVPFPGIWILFVDIWEHTLEEQSANYEACVTPDNTNTEIRQA